MNEYSVLYLRRSADVFTARYRLSRNVRLTTHLKSSKSLIIDVLN